MLAERRNPRHAEHQLREARTQKRSLSDKTAELEVVLHECDPNVMAVLETWLTNRIADTDVTPPTKRSFRWDRGSWGGGVALIVKNKLTCICLTGKPDHETLWCQIDYRWLPALLVVVYRPLGSPGYSLVKIHRYLQVVYKPCQQIILTGDFSIVMQNHYCR